MILGFFYGRFLHVMCKILSAPEGMAHQSQRIAEGRLRFSILSAGTHRHGLASDEPIGNQRHDGK